MRLPEQRLWDRFRRRIKQEKRLHAERIENLVVVGMADVNGITAPSGREWWIELKSAPGPKRATTRVFGEKYGLSIDQVNWHLERASYGARTYILGEDRLRARVYLVHGKDAAHFNEMANIDLWDCAAASTWSGIMELLLEN